MYLITCGASWVNGDYSWVDLSKNNLKLTQPFLEKDLSDPTAYRNILRKQFKCEYYTNLASGGSLNSEQIKLLTALLEKYPQRYDILVLFGLLPFDEENQMNTLVSMNIPHLFIFNTVYEQYLPNGLFNSKDLLSLLSNDFTQVNKNWSTCEVYHKKMFKLYKKQLANLENHHLTAKGNALVAEMIFNEIKSRFI